ncbi:MAG: hypothetical protein K8F91_12975, partial [Candidatus Obscuribacterales bacterium]|nr:hypothetical protein [Candidatus Obscuribacterales bacterium]
LLEHPDPEIKNATTLILRMLWTSPQNIPPLLADAKRLEQLPDIQPQIEAITKQEYLSASPGRKQNTNTYSFSNINTANIDSLGESVWKIKARTQLSHLARDSKKLSIQISQLSNPRRWLHRTMATADKLFEQGESFQALDSYRQVFKFLENVEKQTERASLKLSYLLYSSVRLDLEQSGSIQDLCISTLIKIDRIHFLNGDASIAASYFLLATQKSSYRDNPLVYARAFFMLALSRHKDYNTIGAIKLLKDETNLIATIERVLKEETNNELLTCGLSLLIDLGEFFQTNLRTRQAAIDSLLAAKAVYQRISGPLPETLRQKAFQALLRLGHLLAAKDRLPEAGDTFNLLVTSWQEQVQNEPTPILIRARLAWAVIANLQGNLPHGKSQLTILAPYARDVLETIKEARDEERKLFCLNRVMAAEMLALTARILPDSRSEAANAYMASAWFLLSRYRFPLSNALDWLEAQDTDVISNCISISNLSDDSDGYGNAGGFIDEITRLKANPYKEKNYLQEESRALARV